MKIRVGFVSNSSATAFIITNLTDMKKTLVDFVTETPWLIKQYKEQYDCQNDPLYSQEHLMVSAEDNNITFAPNESKVCIFGDEQDTLIGRVYDYILRGKDISESAKLMDQIDTEGDPEKLAKVAKKWMESLGDPEKEDQFTGVDSPSFKIRFHGWRR